MRGKQGMSWRQLGTGRQEALKELLIERRQRMKLTQQQLADRMGRPQTFVSRVERGSHRVTVIELIELSEALDFDPMAVVRRVKKVKPD